MASAKSIPLSEAETLAVGINHLTIGEIWAGRSELSYALQLAMRHHHDPAWLLPESMDAELCAFIAVVQLADLIYESRTIGRSSNPGIVPSELWETLRLREQGWSDQLKTIQREVQAARETFGFSKEDLKRTQPIRQLISYNRRQLPSARRKVVMGVSRGRVIPFPPRNESAAPIQTKRSKKRLTILLVADHGSLCEMLSLYFKRYGYSVRAADSGETATKVLSRETIHFVLLDLMLPRLDGLVVLNELREKRKGSLPYAIVFSAGASERDRSKVLELGADEYMPKPFHLMRFLERIQTVERYLF